MEAVMNTCYEISAVNVEGEHDTASEISVTKRLLSI
jgi:hypothetical protein